MQLGHNVALLWLISRLNIVVINAGLNIVVIIMQSNSILLWLLMQDSTLSFLILVFALLQVQMSVHWYATMHCGVLSSQ
jgi:hypothetical protein